MPFACSLLQVKAHFAQLCNQIPRPAIDVILANNLPHMLHPHLLFSGSISRALEWLRPTGPMS